MHKIYYRARLASKGEYPIDQVVFIRDNGKTLTILDKLDREIEVKWENKTTAYFNNEQNAKSWLLVKVSEKEDNAKSTYEKVIESVSGIKKHIGFGSAHGCKYIPLKIVGDNVLINVESLKRIIEEK